MQTLITYSIYGTVPLSCGPPFQGAVLKRCWAASAQCGCKCAVKLACTTQTGVGPTQAAALAHGYQGKPRLSRSLLAEFGQCGGFWGQGAGKQGAGMGQGREGGSVGRGEELCWIQTPVPRRAALI